MKQFHIQNNIGKAKYIVSHHDGKKKHRDGSLFFDMTIFKNKKKLSSFVSNLKRIGYNEI